MMTSLRYWGWLVPLGAFGAVAIFTDISTPLLAGVTLASIALLWLFLGRRDRKRRRSNGTDAAGANHQLMT
jgi:hypothetical protein